MKRGRKPLGRKAMTAAERQARRRAKLRKIAKDARRRLDERVASGVRPPPHGYNKAKAKLQAEGHDFERARREFGFDEGLFVDGAFVCGADVVALAELGAGERKQWLDDTRQWTKSLAVGLVLAFMRKMRVSRDELFRDGHEKSDGHEKRHEMHPAGQDHQSAEASS